MSKTNIMSIIGFVLSFFIPIAGLVCSIIGLKQCGSEDEDGRGFAIAGIVISAIEIAAYVLLIALAICIFGIGLSLPFITTTAAA